MAPGLGLNAAQATLLQHAFADNDEIFVEQEFHSGYSGAAAYLISRAHQAPVVVKLAHPLELEREARAYREFVEHTAPQNTAGLQGNLLKSTDSQLGLITYTFAGGDPSLSTHSLLTYYQTQGGRSAAEVLNRIFRRYSRQWWASNETRRLVMAEDYDRLLPVHLQLAASLPPDPPTEAYMLCAGETSVAALRTLQARQQVHLQGFQVTSVRPGINTMRPCPARRTIRLVTATLRPPKY